MLNNIMEEYKNWQKKNLKRRQRRKETTTGFIKNLVNKRSEVDMTKHYDDNKTHDS